MLKAHESILVRQLRALPGGSVAKDPIQTIATITRLAELGFWVDPARVDNRTCEFVHRNYDVLAELVGAHVDHAHLFRGFPDSLPTADNGPLRLMGEFFKQVFDIDLNLDGGWPDSSIPLSSAKRQSMLDLQAKLKGDTHVEWKKLTIIDNDKIDLELSNWVNSIVARPTSLRSDELQDALELRKLIDDISSIPFAETRCAVLAKLWDENTTKAVQSVAKIDDVLRLFAALTDTDVSLATPIKFPALKRAERRLILGRLDNLVAEGADTDTIWRRRNLWLKVAKSLHVGEYRHRYAVVQIFERLRKERYNSKSVNARLERALEQGDTDAALSLLSLNPGLFARRLREAMHDLDSERVMNSFEQIAERVSVKQLVVLYDRLHNVDDRILIVNKQGNPSVEDANFQLSRFDILKLGGIINKALAAKLKDRPFGDLGERKKLTVEEHLSDIVLPLQQRSASEAFLNLERGSKIYCGDNINATLRLFVYWVGQDLDLSLITYDKNFVQVGQVSYTNLRSGDIIHSGDITYAPDGATEYIDVRLSGLNKDVAYVVPQIYNYSGPAFADLEEAFAGWMWRTEPAKGRAAFDGSTVANKFKLDGKARTVTPFVYSVAEENIILCDLPTHTQGWGQSTESATGSLPEQASLIADLSRTRPTMDGVVYRWANANDIELEFSTDPEKCDIHKMTDLSELLV